MLNIYSDMSIIIINVNGLNTPMKIKILSDWIKKKKRPNMLSSKNPL